MKRFSRQSLEDVFFLKQDMELRKKLKEMRELKETREALAAASGIQDDLVLDKFIELNIRPESIASLSLVPLVLVAWADGDVDLKEKEAVLSAVGKFGWGKDSWDYALLDRWLGHKPPAVMLEVWVHYVEALCKKLTAEETGHLKNEIMPHAKTVALACGGILGIGRISAEEKKMLEKLSCAFDVC
ncbi:MAG: hypothetical protein A2297_01345 [Elusimicrobia bacterium RIFOXYB2_FULL_48_7]|nr:MAG: hypothetical protein A2297_01345 [Elusimicrobia bacterium RIFOXYB2_FULL_48_7]